MLFKDYKAAAFNMLAITQNRLSIESHSHKSYAYDIFCSQVTQKWSSNENYIFRWIIGKIYGD